MGEFDFVFTLFGLMLGLTLVEVMMGLARTIEARGKIRIGWLTPLLGVFVMLDLVSFWTVAWEARDSVRMTYGTLVGCLAFAAPYYLAAALVFPHEPKDWPDFDNHYFDVRRKVLGIVLGCNLLQVAVFANHPRLQAGYLSAEFAATFGATVALAFVAMAARDKRANGAALALIILIYLYTAARPLLRW